jgi:hypothetical protein
MSLNVYLEQQYVEDLEDKYAELQRQHELLKKENELLKKECELSKTGNYNLKRDNDILRGDIYNLRLENSKLTTDLANLLESSNADKDELKGKIIILEQEYEALKIQLENERPKTNLLPKVAEKETYRQFMLDCVIPTYHHGTFPDVSIYDKLKQESEHMVDEILADGDEYIVMAGNTLLTNKGKIFIKKLFQQGWGGYPDRYAHGYTNLNIREMNENILQVIKGCTIVHQTGYQFTDENNNRSINMIFGKTKGGKYN